MRVLTWHPRRLWSFPTTSCLSSHMAVLQAPLFREKSRMVGGDAWQIRTIRLILEIE